MRYFTACPKHANQHQPCTQQKEQHQASQISNQQLTSILTQLTQLISQMSQQQGSSSSSQLRTTSDYQGPAVDVGYDMANEDQAAA